MHPHVKVPLLGHAQPRRQVAVVSAEGGWRNKFARLSSRALDGIGDLGFQPTPPTCACWAGRPPDSSLPNITLVHFS